MAEGGGISQFQSTSVGGKTVQIIMFRFLAVSQILRGPEVENFKLFFVGKLFYFHMNLFL
jgi:hypothetical protein